MKSAKFKFAFWFLVFVAVGLFMLQNQEFFKATNSYNINLINIKSLEGVKAFAPYPSPEIANALLFFASFVLGIGLTYFLGFFGWFKSKRTIKTLLADNERLYDKLDELEHELDRYRPHDSDEYDDEDYPDDEYIEGDEQQLERK